MKNTVKKFLALFLAVVMTASLFPVSAFAEGEEELTVEEPAAEEPVVETVPEENVSAEPDPEPEAETPADPEPNLSEEPAEPAEETEEPVEPEVTSEPETPAEPEVTGPLWEQVFSLSAATVGAEYAAELPGTEGEVSAALLADEAVTGLPAGLALTQKTAQDPADNVYVLSGTPAAAGSFSFLLTVADRAESHIYRYEIPVAAAAEAPAETETPALQGAPLTASLMSDGGDEDALASGECGENLAWSLSYDYVLTIEGSGAMDDFDEEEGAPWSAYCYDIEEILLPEGLSTIGDNAFRACCYPVEIAIPSTVTAIGQNAFDNCTSLGSIVIPSGVTTIGNGAFSNCCWAETLSLPDTLITIGEEAFSWCEGLNAINIPSGVTTIGNGAFSFCGAPVTIPADSQLSSLGAGAFNGCGTVTFGGTRAQWQTITGGAAGAAVCSDGAYLPSGSCGENLSWSISDTGLLTIEGSGAMDDWEDNGAPWYSARSYFSALVVEEGVTTIGNSAFESMAISSVSLPSTLTSIGTQAFMSSNITSVSIPSGVTTIGAGAFSDCYHLTSVSFPSDSRLTSLGRGAFNSCTGLSELSLPAGLTEIGDDAFAGCDELSALTLPSGVESVGDYAFAYCRELNISLPVSLTEIGECAFLGCASVSFAGTKAQWAAAGGDASGALPLCSDGAYAVSGTWGDNISWTLSEGMLTVSGDGALAAPEVDYDDDDDYDEDEAAPGWEQYRESITGLTVGEGISDIGEGLFADYERLTTVSLPATLDVILDDAFSWCTELRSVSFAEGCYLEMICQSAFYNCQSLAEISLPALLLDIGNQAFASCYALTTVNLPADSHLSTIGEEAFAYCSSLCELNIPSSVTRIGEGAFCRVQTLNYAGTKAQWESITRGHGGVLAVCSDGVYTPTLPNCGSLSCSLSATGVLTVSGSGPMEMESEWDPYPWSYYLGSIVDLVLEEGVTSVGNQAFMSCRNLRSVSLPESLTVIGETAFGDCGSLTSIVIPDAVTSIGGWAFDSCSSLSSVTLGSGVESIGEQAFGFCFSLSSLTLPESVSSIGGQLFDCGPENESPLKTLTFTGDMPEIDSYAFYRLVNATIYYPADNETYTTLNKTPYGGTNITWTPAVAVIASGTGDDSVWTLYETGELLVSGTGSVPGRNAFGSHTAQIVTVTIEEGITEIDDYAFSGCSNLESVTIPNTVGTIGGGAFLNCSKLTAVTLPASVSDMGSGVFAECSTLTDITVDAANTKYASVDGLLLSKDGTELLCCPGGKSGELTLPQGLTAINPDALRACAKLSSVVVPENVTVIYSGAFAYCTGLSSVSLPVSLECVRETAFEGCTALNDVYYAGSQPDWLEIDIHTGNDSLENAERHYAEAGETDIYGSGTCGDKLTWTMYLNGELVIEGEGDMEEFLGNTDVPWYQWQQEITALYLPAGLTSIPDWTFDGASSLTDVYFAGTALQWISVTVGSQGNNWLRHATLHLAWYEVDGVLHIGHPDLFPAAVESVGADGRSLVCDFSEPLVITEDVSLSKSLTLPKDLTVENLVIANLATLFVGETLYVGSLTVEGTLWAEELECTGTLNALPSHIYCDFITFYTDGRDGFDAALGFAAEMEADGRDCGFEIRLNDCELSLTEDLTVPANTSLYLTNCELSVPTGLTLTVDGNLTLAGDAFAYGLIVDGSCVNNGVIYLKAGARLKQAADGVFTGDGHYSDRCDYSEAALEYDFDGFEAEYASLVTSDSGYYIFSYRPSALSTGVELRCAELAEGNVDGLSLEVDMANLPSLSLGVSVLPASVPQLVSWKTSAAGIATVSDSGLVSFLKPGTVTITAETLDDTGNSAAVTFDVYYLFRDTTLKAGSTAPELGLELGHSANIFVQGDDAEVAFNPGFFDYSVKVGLKDGSSYLSIDENGVMTALKADATATVTATLRGDPQGRKASLKVKLIPEQIEEANLLPAETEVKYADAVTGRIEPGFYALDANGDFAASPEDTVSYALYVAKIPKGQPVEKFSILVSGKNSDGEDVPAAKGLYSWSSSNTKLVTVSEDANGNAVLTVKANVDGACTVTAKAKDLTGAKSSLAVYVMDYTPRLVASSVTLDSQKSNCATVGLVTSYGAEVTDVQFLAYNAKTKKYNVEGKLNAEYADEQVTLSAPSLMKNQTVKGQLVITVAGLDQPVKKTLTVKIKNTVPTVTVTQYQKLNLFFPDTAARLNVVVKGERITDIDMEAASYHISERSTGSDDSEIKVYLNDENDTKPVTAAKLYIYLDGYAFPVTKSIQIAYENNKAAARLSVSTITLSSIFIDRVAETRIDTNQEDLYLTGELTAELKTAPKGVNKAEVQDKFVFDMYSFNGSMYIYLNAPVPNGTYTFALTPKVEFQYADYEGEITPATLTVKVNSALPKLVFDSSTLTLSKGFAYARSKQVWAKEDWYYDVTILDVQTTAKKAAEKAQAGKIYFYFEDNFIFAYMNPDDLPAAGTYSYKVTAKISGEGGEATATTTVKVKVEAAPKLKLSKSSVSLNRSSLTAGAEVAAIDFTAPEEYVLDGTPEITVVGTGSQKAQAQKILVEYSGFDERLYISLDPEDLPAVGTYTFSVTPKLKNIRISEHDVGNGAPVKFSVKVTSSTALSATVKATGKLDTVNRANSGITYTLTKVSNAAGSPMPAELIGPDADLFELEDLGINTKDQPVTILRLKEGEEYSTARTYKVQLQYTLMQADGMSTVTVKTPVLKVKPVQSKLTLKTSPSATQNYYQSQSRDRVVVYDIALKAPAGAVIERVELGKVSYWQAALQDQAKDIDISFTDTAIHIEITMKDTSLFTSGKTYTLPIVITPKGCATNVAATKLNLKLKVNK